MSHVASPEALVADGLSISAPSGSGMCPEFSVTCIELMSHLDRYVKRIESCATIQRRAVHITQTSMVSNRYRAAPRARARDPATARRRARAAEGFFGAPPSLGHRERKQTTRLLLNDMV